MKPMERSIVFPLRRIRLRSGRPMVKRTGSLPGEIYMVTGGPEASANAGKNYFLDVHEFGPGKVSAKDVAAAHQRTLPFSKSMA